MAPRVRTLLSIRSVLRNEGVTPAIGRSNSVKNPRAWLFAAQAFVVFSLFAISACGGDDSSEVSPSATPGPTIPVREPTELELPIRVAVTLPLFEEFVRAAGKENVDVVSVVPAGRLIPMITIRHPKRWTGSPGFASSSTTASISMERWWKRWRTALMTTRSSCRSRPTSGRRGERSSGIPTLLRSRLGITRTCGWTRC